MQFRWTWCLALITSAALCACSATGGGTTSPSNSGDKPMTQTQTQTQIQSSTPSGGLFLEVGPQRKACNLGKGYGTQCLQVREIRYDSNGRQTFTGPWEDYFGEIDGYTHQAGVSSVLLMKRYQPAGSPNYGYVLDKVVSSTRESQRK